VTRDRLGKGLGALLGEYLEPEAKVGEGQRLPLAAIVPNPLQPRKIFTDVELEELAASIRDNGLLQPLVVRPAPGAADRYELVAGERRFRAVAKLGWRDVPVLVREASDETLLVLALVENLQREQLNAIEEAEGYAALTEQFGMSHADIARAVGKSRSTVANFLRLLDLPPSIRRLVEDGELTQGHVRPLLTLGDPARAGELARLAAKEGWSVREMERRAAGQGKRPAKASSGEKPPVVRALEEALRDHFLTRVEVKERRGGKGSVEIHYHDPDDFGRIFELITRRTVSDIVE